MRELILAPGEGLSVENPTGGLITFKITSDLSDGALTAIEGTAAPQEGPPLHVHEQDEVIYTLEGTLRVKLGETLREVPPGSFVRGVLHALRAAACRGARRRGVRTTRSRDECVSGRRSSARAV